MTLLVQLMTQPALRQQLTRKLGLLSYAGGAVATLLLALLALSR